MKNTQFVNSTTRNKKIPLGFFLVWVGPEKNLYGGGCVFNIKNKGRGCTKFWEIMFYGGRNCPHTRFLDHPYPPYNIFIPPYNIFIPPYNIFQKSCRGVIEPALIMTMGKSKITHQPMLFCSSFTLNIKLYVHPISIIHPHHHPRHIDTDRLYSIYQSVTSAPTTFSQK